MEPPAPNVPLEVPDEVPTVDLLGLGGEEVPTLDLLGLGEWIPLDAVTSSSTLLVDCGIRPCMPQLFYNYQNPGFGKRCASLRKNVAGTICTKWPAHAADDIFADFVDADLARHGHRFLTTPACERQNFEIEPRTPTAEVQATFYRPLV